MDSNSSKPKISFIGSGNVACHLAKAFYGAGCRIGQVWSRNWHHASRVAQLVDAEPIDAIGALSGDEDFLVIAVKDDAIASVASQLESGNAMVVHTSGTTDIEVLRGTSSHFGVVWPFQTLSSSLEVDYRSLPLCVEGNDEESAERLLWLVGLISGNTFVLNGEQRKWAHLAAVMANNFGNFLNASAQQMLTRHGIPFELIAPIVQATAQRMQSLKPGESLIDFQTGPAIRHDENTLNRHRAMLSDNPQLLQLYNLFTDLIQNFEKRND